MSVTKGGKKNENPTALTNIAKDQIEMYKNDMHIYTDASKTTEGKTAAAFFVPELNVKVAARLSNDISIFSAELIAIIKMSLDWVLEFSKQFSLIKNIAIFSDSLSSLTAIKAGKSTCRPNTLNEINDIVDNIKVDVKFIWIPSHLGIVGNETVDQLAQSATTNNRIGVNISFELDEIYTKIQKFILAKWQTYWQTCNTGSFYRKIEPNVSFRIKYETQVRAKETIITRLRLGSYLTNEYLKRINVLKSDKCDKCENSVDTIEHFLLQCANSLLCSEVLNACERFNVVPQLEFVLKNNDIIHVIYRNIKMTII